MRKLIDRTEIAREINLKRTTTVRIDLADADEYGLKSQNVLIDNGTFRNGDPYFIRAVVRAYADKMEFTFSAHGIYATNDFGYYDIEEMAEYANAPIVKKDSDVVLVIVDSRKKETYYPVVMHTADKINEHCMTPLTFIDEDNSALGYMINCEKWDTYKELFMIHYLKNNE